MSEPFVTALVLLDGASTRTTAHCTVAALLAQTRRPDRIIIAIPDSAPEDLRTQAETDRAIDAQIRVPANLTPAQTATAAITQLSEPFAQDDRSDPLAPADPPATSAGGRRARSIDREDRDRRLAEEAESLALVPHRLREAAPRGGRRMSRTAGAGEEWFWFIPDGSAPGTDSLAGLLTTVADSPRTAVIGAKRLLAPRDHDPATDPAPTADDAHALLDMGLTLTHGGRIATGVEPGEIDQGQADWREDVLAVSLAGMLIRGRTLQDLGGFDPDLPAPWAEIDLCRRVWRSGERVAVQSRARVLVHRNDRPVEESLRDHRRGQLLALLKQRSGIGALLLLISLPVQTLARAFTALLASQPREAVAELRAWAGAMRSAGAVMRRGARSRAAYRVPQARLAPLYVPRGEELRQQAEALWTRLFADDERSRRIRLTTWGVAGTRHGIDDADYGRHLVWSVVLAIAATVLGVIGLRSVLGRGDLIGPALIPLPHRAVDTFTAAWSTWIPAGLGSRGPADPILRLLGSIPLPGDLLVETILFTAIPISAMAAWWASGALTRAIGARLVLASVWALAPSLLAALGTGAWPLLLVHMLLPLLALAIGKAIGLPHKIAQSSHAAAVLGGLLLLVIGAVQPVLVLLVAAALAVIAVGVPGRRRRLLWVLVPSLALHAPYIPVYIAHPQYLLAAGAVGPVGAPAGPLDLLALWPVASPIRAALESFAGGMPAQLLLMLPVLLLLPAAAVSGLLGGAAGKVGRAGLMIAALAGGAAMWDLHVRAATANGVSVPAPLHALLSMLLLAAGASAAATFDALARRDAEVGQARRRLGEAIALLAAAGTAGLVVLWALQLPTLLRIERTDTATVPAAAADLGRSEARGRVLILQPDPGNDGGAIGSLLVQGEDSAAQRAAIEQVRTAEDPGRLERDRGDKALRTASAQLLSRGSQEAGPALRTLAVGYIVVPGKAENNAALVDALDASPLLEKVTQTATGSLWRVAESGARAEVRSDDGSSALTSGMINAYGRITASAHGRTLVLSERAESGWRATVDGRDLTPVTVDGWAQGFTIPAGVEGPIEVERDQPWTLAWQILLLGATVLTLAMSIPWSTRARTREALYG